MAGFFKKVVAERAAELVGSGMVFDERVSFGGMGFGARRAAFVSVLVYIVVAFSPVLFSQDSYLIPSCDKRPDSVDVPSGHQSEKHSTHEVIVENIRDDVVQADADIHDYTSFNNRTGKGNFTIQVKIFYFIAGFVLAFIGGWWMAGGEDKKRERDEQNGDIRR